MVDGADCAPSLYRLLHHRAEPFLAAVVVAAKVQRDFGNHDGGVKGDCAIERRRQNEFIASRSKRCGEICEGALCAVLRVCPCGRLHEGEPGLRWRVACSLKIIGNR